MTYLWGKPWLPFARTGEQWRGKFPSFLFARALLLIMADLILVWHLKIDMKIH